MSRYVVDASVAVEYLLKTPVGLDVADIIDNASLVAPGLMDAEVLSALRRAVLQRRLTEARARIVIANLSHWSVNRISHQELASVAWRYYQNVTAYDAFYVASRLRPRNPPLDRRRPPGQSARAGCGCPARHHPSPR